MNYDKTLSKNKHWKQLQKESRNEVNTTAHESDAIKFEAMNRIDRLWYPHITSVKKKIRCHEKIGEIP